MQLWHEPVRNFIQILIKNERESESSYLFFYYFKMTGWRVAQSF